METTNGAPRRGRSKPDHGRAVAGSSPRRTAVTLWFVGIVTIALCLGWTIASVPAASSAVTIGAEDEGGGAVAPDPAPEPAPAASAEASAEPAAEVTAEASADPTDEPSADPSDTPSDEPSDEPSDDPSDEPTDEPTDDPSDDAADEPTDEPTDNPVDEPTDEPSIEASAEPVASEEPIPAPTETAAASGVVVKVNGAIGTKVGDVGIDIQGAGVAPASQYSLWVFSQPQLLTSGSADAAGVFAASAKLPGTLEPGSHTIVLQTTSVDGQAVESATGITISTDGTLAGVVDNVDASQLVVPKLSDNPKAPKYAPVAPLDNPAAVVAAAVAGLTVATVAGAGLGGGSGGGGSSGGGSGGGGADDSGGGLEAEVRRRKKFRGSNNSAGGLWQAKFVPDGNAIGDNSWLYRAPGRAIVDRASYVSIAAVASKSPLLSRCLGDAAPMRAMFGSVSLLLPIAGIVLGLLAGLSVDGIAQPAAAGIMIALVLIGIFDAAAGLLAAIAFTLVVVLSGGIIDAGSVRTLAGIGLLIVGPGVIGGSFRDIRRPSVSGSFELWERLTDLVVVPLLGGWVTYNIVMALPGLGGAAFPIADSAMLIAVVVFAGLVAKVLVEDAAARWFPERMDSLTPDEPDEAPNSQRLVSALLRMGTFAFISAAFVGNVWQLWAASLLFLVPALTEIVAERFPNSPRMWQAIPEGVPLITFMLIVSWVVSAALVGALGDSPDYAQTMFVVLAVPGFALALLGVFGREPREGDTRWYQRPSMTALYRVGGIVVLIATGWLVMVTS